MVGKLMAFAREPEVTPMAALSNYQIAHDLVERRITTLEAVCELDGFLTDEDAAELRAAKVLRDRVQRAGVDAVYAALESCAI